MGLRARGDAGAPDARESPQAGGWWWLRRTTPALGLVVADPAAALAGVPVSVAVQSAAATGRTAVSGDDHGGLVVLAEGGVGSVSCPDRHQADDASGSDHAGIVFGWCRPACLFGLWSMAGGERGRDGGGRFFYLPRPAAHSDGLFDQSGERGSRFVISRGR